MSQTVSVTLPEPLYQRVRETAAALARSIQDVLAESIALSLPPLEDDLPPAIRSELGPMALLKDEELRRLGHETLARDRQSRLEAWPSVRRRRR